MIEKGTTEIIVTQESELESTVEKILRFANGRKKFTLIGDLGAGKTTLTQYFCKKIGVKDNVTSPTFSLVNEYVFEENGKTHRFYHLDLYRVKDLDEALAIGIEDYLFGEEYCFVEWPEVVAPLLPEDVVHIKISILADLRRKILLL